MTRFWLLILSLFLTGSAFAQGAIRGQVTDAATGEGVPFANLVVQQNGIQISGAATDFDGFYNIAPLEGGTYDVLISCVGFPNKKIEGVKLSPSQSLKLDIKMEQGITTETFEVVAYKVPLIKTGDVSTTFTAEDLEKRGTLDLNQVAASAPRVTQKDEGQAINAGGARSDANDTYVDGVRVRGNVATSIYEVEQMQVITGGVPASIGDATGQVTNIVTKTPSAKYEGFLSAESSQFLDAYKTNRVDVGVSGPLITRKRLDGNGNVVLDSNEKPVKDVVLGLRLSATAFTSKDARPSALGSFQLKDDVLDAIRQDPTQLVNGGIQPRALFLTEDDLLRTKVRPNNRDTYLQFGGTLYYKINQDMEVRLGGQMYTQRFRNAGDGSRLLNYDRNAIDADNDWRVRLSFKHKIPTGESKAEKGLQLQNAYYQLQVDYNQNNRFTQDNVHKDNLFNYGYVGAFRESYDTIYTPSIEFDSITGQPYVESWTQGYNRAFVSYTPDLTINPTLSNYNNYVDEFAAAQGQEVNRLTFPSRNGTISTSVSRVLDFHDNAGVVFNLYQKQQFNQLRAQVNGGFDLASLGTQNRHSIQFGLVFEQRIDRSYSLNPSGLWVLADLYANDHISFDADTTLLLGTTTQLNPLTGLQDTVKVYDTKLSGSQGVFAENLRNSLGINSQHTWVNVQGLRPDQLSLSMFDPDALITAPNDLLNYYGYDYLGNAVGADVKFNDFWTQKDPTDRFLLRPVAPFTPIYSGFWLEDRFQYKDMFFRLGLRADLYDANTRQLKDQYSIYGAYTANEIANSEYDVDLPSSIPSTAMVYVDNPEGRGEARVMGFRDGDTWYNANGVQVNSVAALGAVGADLFPARKDYSKELNIKASDGSYNPDNSFVDYKPSLIVMPRLAFSFPIADKAEFFAHYDVLTRRPSAGESFATPIDYYNFDEKNSDGDIFANPALTPQRKVDYEAGFQQALNDKSAIKLSLFYSEFRDLIQTTRLAGAYPNQYLTYGNRDFATTKGLTIEYDLRRLGNLRMTANYTLQFANGTGSSSTSNRNLASTVLTVFPLSYDQRHTFNVNVDYRYKDGKDYNGPVLFGKNIFENAGVNLFTTFNSGQPYTSKAIATRFDRNSGTSAGFQTTGSLNGASTPWNFRVDLRIDKDFVIGKEKFKSPLHVNVYFRVQNLLNRQNIINVYPATGSPTDDGYLSDLDGDGPQEVAQYQALGVDFETLYNLRVQNPGNISLPRRMFIGLGLRF